MPPPVIGIDEFEGRWTVFRDGGRDPEPGLSTHLTAAAALDSVDTDITNGATLAVPEGSEIEALCRSRSLSYEAETRASAVLRSLPAEIGHSRA